MRRHWISLGIAVALFAGPTAWAQPPATELKSIQPDVQSADWAKDWWGKRHEEKLAEKKERGQIDMVMIGDSITHGWEGAGKATWEKYYGSRNALNLGFSGDRTEQVIWRLQHGEVEGIAPKLVVLMIGTNNAGHRKEKSADTAAGVKAILEELGKRLPDTKCLVLAIFPRGAKPERRTPPAQRWHKQDPGHLCRPEAGLLPRYQRQVPGRRWHPADRHHARLAPPQSEGVCDLGRGHGANCRKNVEN